MSVVDRRDVKMDLHRTGQDPFWTLIEREFAGDDRLLWKYLAMLALRENAGWPLHSIGKVFGHPKGHVTRCLRRIKQLMRERFDREELDVAAIDWVD